MRWWYELKYLVRKLNRRRAERELEGEIRAHLEMEASEKIDDGLTPEEARYAARRAFGSVAIATEESRAMWGFGTLEILWQDLRYGIRLLRTKPGFAAAAVLSLALGIGANTTIFTLVNALLLRPLPVTAPAQLVSVYGTDENNRGQFLSYTPLSYLNFRDYREQSRVFSGLVAHTRIAMSLTTAGEPQQAPAEIVSADYFDVLGVKAFLGRTFTSEEDKILGAQPVVVLSHALWQTRFGGAPTLVGKTVRLNNLNYTVIGIAPQHFRGTDLAAASDLWIPMMMHDHVFTGAMRDYFNSRRSILMDVTGRLKPGVSFGQAEGEMKAIAARLEQQYPRENVKRGVSMIPLSHSAIHPNFRRVFVQSGAMLMAVVGLVLLIACANVANLLLVRSEARRREIAMRLALGARRGRLVRQLLTESFMLAGLGGALGLLLAVWGRELLWALRPPFLQNTSIDISLNGKVLGFTLLLSLLTSLIFGLAPAWRASRAELVADLKGKSAQASHGHRWFSLRHALIVFQVALSLVALIGAGLFLRSLHHARRINPGFETEKMMTLSFVVGALGYSEAQGQEFYRRAEQRVETIPGVERAAVSSVAPFAWGFHRTVTPDGGTLPGGQGILVTTNQVCLKYFDALGIALLDGRQFTERDREGVSRIAIINEAAASLFWPGQNAIGKRFRFYGDDSSREIVGLARNTVALNLGEEPQPQIFLPIQQNYSPAVTLFVRTQGNPADVLNAVRREVQSLDQNLPLVNIKTLPEILGEALWAPRMSAALLGFFGALALVLAAVGLYGVMAYTVTERKREIGIRLALGAERDQILLLVLKRGLGLVAVGALLGVGAGWLALRMLTNLLYDVSVVDPLTFVAMPTLLFLVALVACYLPARRAMKVDPLLTLRCE